MMYIDDMKQAKSLEELDTIFKAIPHPTPEEIEAYEDLRQHFLVEESINLNVQGRGFRYYVRERREDMPDIQILYSKQGTPVPDSFITYRYPEGSTFGAYYPELRNNRLSLAIVNSKSVMLETQYDIYVEEEINGGKKHRKKNLPFSKQTIDQLYLVENLINNNGLYTEVKTNLIIPEIATVRWIIYSYWQVVNDKVRQLEFFILEGD